MAPDYHCAVMQLQTIFLGIAAVCFFPACDKAGFSYENAAGGGNVQYTLIDTLSINMRTVQPDSVASSGTGMALAGGYRDAYFGNITTGSYFRVALPDSREIDDKAVFDSIELVMRPTGYSYGDTLPPQTFRLHQLTQPLELPEEYTVLFTHMRWPYNNTPLGVQQFDIRPTSGERLHLRLADSKGLELFNMLKDDVTDVSTDDLFHEYFKGLYLTGSNNTAVFGFEAKDSSLYLRLHYHVVTHEKEEKYLDFLLSKPGLQYNTVQADRSGTPLAALKPGTGLYTAETNNMAYLQSLTGALVRMDFPSLPSLQELGRYGRIMRAELVLRPVTGTYAREALPPQLNLGLADNFHYIAPGDSLAAGTGTVQHGALSVDKLYPENTVYTYDVTEYCKAMINADSYTYRGLVLCPPPGAYGAQLNRLVLGDGRNSKYRAQLKIYYLLYQ